MHLELFLLIGLLYAGTGVVLQALYWGEVPWQIVTMFLLLGTGIFVIVNRYWFFQDWEAGYILFYLGGMLLFAGWIVSLLVVRIYLEQRRELSNLKAVL